MRRSRTVNAVALAQQLLRALGHSVEPSAANDDSPVIDEQALRARAMRAADRMRRARSL